MGVLTKFLNMDTKPVYCHGSSGKLMNQYMIKDHMLSHYKKLYSAKAAVDCSVPKSMQCNVKYVDQKRRELKKDAPSRSGRSESQRSSRFNSRASSSSKISGASDKGDHYLDHSVMSSPRISTSFHSKQIVYPSRNIRASADHFRSASELQGYRSPNLQSGHSSSVSQRQYKTFQDPKQKTYSGDVLLKHAHHFTQEEPFTPRTLKSSHKSTLAQYRYYTAPKRKDEETSSFQMTRLESSQSKRGFSPQLVSPQTFSVVHEWSDEESDSFRRHRTADYLLSSSRVSPEGMKSPVMRRVTAEEEELMYLEFITDVTNEILAQGLYSDRVLKRVFERHIDMNRHRLDENKMRHLLDNLHHDLQKPSDVSVSFPSIRDPLKLQEKSLKLAHGLPSETTDDADVIIPNEVRGQRENITCTPIEKQPLNLEFASGCLNDNEHVTCVGNTADDNELLDRVEEVEKSMRKLLNVSETKKSETEEEQMTNQLSDDDF